MGPAHRRGGARLSAVPAPAASPRALGAYLFGTGSWFAATGMQSVLFTWLVTVQLAESPEKVGLAQFCLLLPTLGFILFAGAVADRVGGARIALAAQALAVLPVVGLALVVGADRLAYGALVVYALAVGTAQAFLTPARDGLLPQVAGTRIQRTVVLASLVQFGVQILGYAVAGTAETVGPARVLAVQAGLLAAGAVAFAVVLRRIPPVAAPAGVAPASLLAQLREGVATVLASPPMRSVTLLNAGMGVFYMGAFQVGLPLLLRAVHGATPQQLALVNGVHMVGVVLCTLALLRIGDVERHGRALVLALLVGAVALTGMGLAGSFVTLLAWNFLWGVAGGVALSMSRTVIQELAPPAQRARVMSVFAFAFLGSGPLGALLSGALVERVGVHLALVLPAVAMAACTVLVALRTALWRGPVAAPAA